MTGHFEAKAEPADALLERTESWLTAACDAARGRRVELFHRAAWRVRVARTGIERPRVSVGREEGVALRLRDPEGRREGFAASACGPSGMPLDWLLERAGETAGPTTAPWREEPARMVDEDPDATLPAAAELEAWLSRALASLEHARPTTDSVTARATAWVESALTIESLVHDGGLSASRSRVRVWASASHRDWCLPDAPERPHVLAARRLEDLDAASWAQALDATADGARSPSRASESPLAFQPEAAAALVSILVPILHGPGAVIGAGVGPGWSLADEPRNPSALVGGTFDDVGFAADRCILADGGAVRAALAGPGRLRRPSYRDRPEPGPSLLVVSERERAVPDGAWRIRSARTSPVDGRSWLVEIDGLGGAGAIVRGGRVVATPERLAAACTGSFGRPRHAAWGVVTPGLILEGLRVEG